MAYKNESKLFIRIITSFIESGRVGLIALSLILIPGVGSAQNQGPDKQVVAAEKTTRPNRGSCEKASRSSSRSAHPLKRQAGGVDGGRTTLVRFKITDDATGAALTGLRPGVWMNGRTGTSRPKAMRAGIWFNRLCRGASATVPTST